MKGMAGFRTNPMLRKPRSVSGGHGRQIERSERLRNPNSIALGVGNHPGAKKWRPANMRSARANHIYANII